MSSFTVIGRASDSPKPKQEGVVSQARDYISGEVADTIKGVRGLKEPGVNLLGKAKDFISKAPNPLNLINDAALLAASKTIEGFQIASTTPIKTMLDDIFVPNMGRDITENHFSEEAVMLLQEMASGIGLKPGDRRSVNYEDYNAYGAQLSARFSSGVNEDVEDLKGKLLDLSPADELKMTLGEATLFMDEAGNVTLEDQYDFNTWAHFGEGKGSDGKYQTYSADEFEDLDITFSQALRDTIANSPSDYQMARNLAFLFGSRDYEDPERDTGRKVRINLSGGQTHDNP